MHGECNLPTHVKSDEIRDFDYNKVFGVAIRSGTCNFYLASNLCENLERGNVE